MSQIGTLTGGAAVVTTLNLQFVPEYLLIGDVSTDIPLTAMSWNIAEDERVNITGAALAVAYSKYKNEALLGADVKLSNPIAVADGYYGNQQFQLRLTNAGVATPNIYAFSRRKGGGRVMGVSQAVILDGASQGFAGFVALQMLPTNVTRVDITFEDNLSGSVFSESFSPAELAALFSIDNQADASGLTGTILTIDNAALLQPGLSIKNAVVYASGANVTVNIVGIENL